MKKIVLVSTILVLLTSFLTACTSLQSEEVYRETRFLFDTEVFVEAYGVGAEKAVKQAMEIMKEIDLPTNFYSADSEITKLNEAAGKYPVPLSTLVFELLQRSLQISELTHGYFDPTIGPLVQLWQNAKEENLLPSAEEVEDRLQLVDYRNLLLDSSNQTAFLPKEGMSIDLGAVTKGFAVEKGMEILKKAGITSAIVRAGGNVYTIGNKTDGTLWKVGIRDPHQPENTVGYIVAENKVVDTAANYEQSMVVDGINIGHIINPHTGFPAEEIASCTIISNNPTLADALSTAVFILGKEKGLALIQGIPDTEGIMIEKNGSQHMTREFKGMFEVEK